MHKAHTYDPYDQKDHPKIMQKYEKQRKYVLKIVTSFTSIGAGLLVYPFKFELNN